ncbi:hypothetical protein M3J09_007245 [Ascochyta lentis]
MSYLSCQVYDDWRLLAISRLLTHPTSLRSSPS